MELRSKTAIITGSGSGIGRALALGFARQGANVVCCARREAEIERTVELIRQEGGHGLAIATDVTLKDQVDSIVRKAIAAFGQIDVLFNNAGSFQTIGGLWEVDADAWWHDVAVNLRGPMLCCQAVLPHMMERDDGIIINMNGGGSTVPLPGGSGYGCSKAGLIRLTDTLARELERVGSQVLVFGMGPGLVRTEMTELQTNTEKGREWIPSTAECFESGRTRNPDDCAKSTIELIRVACPELSGRNFGAGADFDDILKRKDEIQKDDLYVMRSR